MERHGATAGSPSDAREARAPAYERRRPEEGLLYRVVQAELETLLHAASERDRPVPAFVEREMRGFLQCGILAHGFLRVHCDACGHDRLVAFSCKGRAFCPSCGARRMADTAAHLVDRVVPETPVRQWVLTLPFALRYRLAYDAGLTSAVLREFVRALFASYRRGARRRGPVARARTGAVTFIQRFGDALNLNVHFHTLVLDGVYERYGEPGMRFMPQPPPDNAEVRRVLLRVARRIGRLLERRGPAADADPSEADPLGASQPLLAGLAASSVRGHAADGRPLKRRGDRVDPEALAEFASPRCAAASGYTLHADVAVPARDRRRLERLCRYAARPPIGTERLEQLDDGRLLYRLRHRWRDGTTHVVFEPQELVERLVPLIPAPRTHQIRYHGVLAPCAGWREQVVPVTLPSNKAARFARFHACSGEPTASAGEAEGGPASPRESGPVRGSANAAGAGESARQPRETRRYAWADLLRRVFDFEVLDCPECGGRLRIIAAIHPPEATRAILDCLGLPSRAPPLAPARSRPEPAQPAQYDW